MPVDGVVVDDDDHKVRATAASGLRFLGAAPSFDVERNDLPRKTDSSTAGQSPDRSNQHDRAKASKCPAKGGRQH